MNDDPLTKSDFLAFFECEKDFWLRRRRPDAVDRQPPGEFDRLLMLDGYAVEAVARAMLEGRPDADRFTYQKEFTNGRCLIRTDAVGLLPDGCVELYEVKSSTSPKDHLVDVCFQRIVAEKSGAKVARSWLIHVNADYRRHGELDAIDFLLIADVDDAIAAIRPEIEKAVDRALAIMASEAIDETGCGCVLKSSGRHCPSFAFFNPNHPDPSAHMLPRMSGTRLAKLVEQNRLGIEDIAPDDVTPAQLPVLLALKSGAAQIDHNSIRAFLANLAFPLHFYDYETAAGAIPQADGHGPHEQIPVQFSCHVLSDDGSVDHHEFLAKAFGDEALLVEALGSAIGDAGSVLVWNETFEKSCNRRMARLVPSHDVFLESVNARTVDLMAPFRKHYVHPGFGGSTSIKKVLPVLCPSLSYEDLAVHDGTSAILAFREMVACTDHLRRDLLRSQLLEYCRLDTLAMLEIYRVLMASVDTSESLPTNRQ